MSAGLEWIFRGQCHWGKYKDNEALFVKGPSTRWQQKIVIFAGGGKEDSYKKDPRQLLRNVDCHEDQLTS